MRARGWGWGWVRPGVMGHTCWKQPPKGALESRAIFMTMCLENTDQEIVITRKRRVLGEEQGRVGCRKWVEKGNKEWEREMVGGRERRGKMGCCRGETMNVRVTHTTFQNS